MSDAFGISVSLADVTRWEKECARIDEQIAGLTARREKFAQMIALAKEVASEAPVSEPAVEEKPAEEEKTTEAVPERAVPLKHGGSRRREETWKHALEVLIKAHPDGVSYDKLKELVPAKLQAQLRAFPAAKGFYKALRVLEEEKVIVRHQGMAFPKKAYDKYLARVAAGRAQPIVPVKRESPIANAIIEFLRENGASKGAAIRAHLVKFPGFGPSVLRNSSALYNVLLRLKERGEIVHDAEEATYSLAHENGAPASASAPDTGEAATSPFENVVGFPRSR